ncbi:hypothetical protein [Pseudaminobacter soli (ex Li et al. 2025)]|uniref:Uncharacterized protein n=1 Tax=Pseudaminobacter soli (ex Li et al. 2025) TaxID=1295366 RepID=A0A2P7SKX1_9HYPH|nr:hypothetical protein [Mesorhizobium soli]PSJ63107.1 hypothetical protein C7I85_06025 [Mesorhizobium soli]
MNHAGCGESDERAHNRDAGVLKATDWLGLAASPTFAIMALLTSVFGSGQAEMLCSGMQWSPLSGMATMYVLMSAFHSAPWLKLASRLGSQSKF